MSALDQAFIKAYAKDGPPQSDATLAWAGTPASGNPAAAARQTPARIARPAPAIPGESIHVESIHVESIERIYHEAALYRVDVPRATTPRRVAVPTPHFPLPPPTSPKRNVRRSMLQLFGQASEQSTPMPVEPPARLPGAARPAQDAQQPARATRTLLEIAEELAPLPVPQPAPVQRPTDPPVRRASRAERAPEVELAPEFVIDAPPRREPAPNKSAPEPKLPVQPLFAPAVAPQPNVAPLNLAQEFGPHFEVHGHWESDLAASPAALVITPEPADLQITEPAPLVELKLEALPAARASIAPRATNEPDAPAIPSFRVDPPHAAVAARPHAKFPSAAADAPIAAELIDDQPQGKSSDATDEATERGPEAAPAASPAPQELNFADQEAATELAPQQVEARSETTAGAAANRTSAVGEPGAETITECVPLWEVDRFQWPVTVERLVSDKEGYFAQASGRLLAAIRDGLRTLAISGSRRGEGRTTLALALARTAAKAGIQVAVIDADFARPQLAARIGLEIHHGWQDAATGLVPLSETAVRSLADNVTVLPLEGSAARTGLSLADPRVTATLRAAAATFELVIVDLGPLAASDEPLFPAEEACPLDAAIVVRDLRYASASESEDVGQRLMAAGIEAVGIAENFVVEEEIPATSV